MASPCEGFRLLLAPVLGIFKLSLDEWSEFMILGLMTIGMPGLLSFHHLEKFGNLLLQHLQQQHRIIMTRSVVTIATYDRKDK
jgi:hypothetical protein